METVVEYPEIEHELNLWAQCKEDVLCVFDRDPAARNWFEVLTTYPGVHAILIHRLGHFLWHRGWRYPSRLLSWFSRLVTNIDIHPGAEIGRRFFIDHGIGVVIGETAIIGDDCTLYHGVTLGGTSWNKGRRHPTLGNGVLIGAGAKVLGAITLGENVQVGANSVVIKDVPPNSSVVGIPGKVVKRSSRKPHSKHGVDLEHHLIPDPVGRAMSCMLERIVELENQLDAATSSSSLKKIEVIPVPKQEQGDNCPTCNAADVCNTEEIA
ncbi:serine O-acetyltransferase [Candidatus Albibeggiatoa sp. nov. BB20]|uniref:serine O-acetyltransferase n=1 Tax=Candidatus Albibeggiatoa sp. nov. BB20 TaxID=3162723 RepID=UPI0033654CA4